MCIAYEVGKIPNAFSAADAGDGIRYLLGNPRRSMIKPAQDAPVMMEDGSMRTMSWGLRRKFEGKKGRTVEKAITTIREKDLHSPMWGKIFSRNRCLVPAVGFFEMVEGPADQSIPLRFHRPEDQLIWMAGIWEMGEGGECFSIIVTDPNVLVSRVHDDMPAILTQEQFRLFLDGELQEFGPSKVSLVYAKEDRFLAKKERKG